MAMSNYAVMRNGKIKLTGGRWGKVGGVDKHNQRLESQNDNENKLDGLTVELDDDDHIDKSRTQFNQNLEDSKFDGMDLKSRIQNRIKEAKVERKLLADAVVGREVLLTTSPEYWGDWKSQIGTPAFTKKLDDWKKASMKVAAETLGQENIVQASLHLDEKTPHLHIVAVPILERDGKNRLCAKEMMTPLKLRQFQTAYAEAMAPFGLQRGVVGSKAKHQHFKEHAEQEKLKEKLLADLAIDQAKQVDEALHKGWDSAINHSKNQVAVEVDRLVKANEQVWQEKLEDAVANETLKWNGLVKELKAENAELIRQIEQYADNTPTGDFKPQTQTHQRDYEKDLTAARQKDEYQRNNRNKDDLEDVK
jgi:hypothetical protein